MSRLLTFLDEEIEMISVSKDKPQDTFTIIRFDEVPSMHYPKAREKRDLFLIQSNPQEDFQLSLSNFKEQKKGLQSRLR